MIFRIVCVVLLLTPLVGCNEKEVARLKQENDSLRAELDNRHRLVLTLQEVKGMLDSIDLNRKVLRADLQEGTTYEKFSQRLGEINQYVKRSEAKIESIQKDLRASKGQASAYLLMVDALKGELEIRAEEVQQLESAVAQYKNENKGLINTVKLQEAEMADLYAKIEMKQQELSLLEAKVDEMVQAFKVSDAEAHYARARAVEEAARRTRLAPNKRKETYKEALELYKKSLSLGKEEARAKITELEKKIR